jgi:hypothetical protein
MCRHYFAGLEGDCLADIDLEHDFRKPDGGKAVGLGSLDPYRVGHCRLLRLEFWSDLVHFSYQRHCQTDTAHKQARDKRQEIRKKVQQSRLSFLLCMLKLSIIQSF